jgi:hypothetical protein
MDPTDDSGLDGYDYINAIPYSCYRILTLPRLGSEFVEAIVHATWGFGNEIRDAC